MWSVRSGFRCSAERHNVYSLPEGRWDQDGADTKPKRVGTDDRI